MRHFMTIKEIVNQYAGAGVVKALCRSCDEFAHQQPNEIVGTPLFVERTGFVDVPSGVVDQARMEAKKHDQQNPLHEIILAIWRVGQ